MNAYLDLKQLKILRNLQNQKKKIIFTNGCFDILHVGHVSYLKEAKKLGDYLIVGLNSDQSVKNLKGPTRPYNNQNDRLLVLSELKSVDLVVVFDETTPLKLIQEISPSILVKGGDWDVKSIVGSEYVLSQGGTVKSLPFIHGYSTTKVLDDHQGRPF